MPRGFSEEEQAGIRSRLREEGANIFARYGLRKTTVEDLARAAGIAKGSFYNFYNSKEELLFDIHEQIEQEAHQRIRALLHSNPDNPGAVFRGIFSLIGEYSSGNGLAAIMSRPEEYQQYIRRLPREKVEAHLAGDETFAEEILAFYQPRGYLSGIDAPLLSGIIKSLFMLRMHKEALGKAVFDDVAAFLGEAIIKKLTEK